MNRLQDQFDRCARGRWGGRKAVAHQETHRALLADWATLNGLKQGADFPVGTLARGGTHKRDEDFWKLPRHWYGRRFPFCWKRNNVAEAITLEPYPHDDVLSFMAFASRNGLAIHLPPNPRASFWFPDRSLFVVVTRPDFGDVRWLPEQVNFEPTDAEDRNEPEPEY